jgi:hypothetical protein
MNKEDASIEAGCGAGTTHETARQNVRSCKPIS